MLWLAAFVVVRTVIILVFAVTVMRSPSLGIKGVRGTVSLGAVGREKRGWSCVEGFRDQCGYPAKRRGCVEWWPRCGEYGKSKWQRSFGRTVGLHEEAVRGRVCTGDSKLDCIELDCKFPMAQTNDQARKDEESALAHSRELPDLEQSKDFRATESEESPSGGSFELNRKNLATFVASVIIIVPIIVFSVLVFSTKNPKFRVRSVVVENLNYSSSSNPSFSMRSVAEMTVKNPNYGYL
ncbi:hypothetical protein QQP08_009655 [Theobroma cacao]|nr:hypothetical protein QQP08_009655 [Theobroma cacao]